MFLNVGFFDVVYGVEFEWLNNEFVDSVFFVGDVVDVWVDFLVGGVWDFDGFKNVVLGSFKLFLVEMIVIVVCN